MAIHVVSPFGSLIGTAFAAVALQPRSEVESPMATRATSPSGATPAEGLDSVPEQAATAATHATRTAERKAWRARVAGPPVRMVVGIGD